MLVLIVEDNPIIALDLRDLVMENTDADVVMSGTVASTAELLDQPFDFAFFDVDLPDGKSYGLASQMLARNIPFVFVSGSRRKDLPAELRDVPFVSKPFLPCDIARALRRMPALVHEAVHANAAAFSVSCRAGTVN